MPALEPRCAMAVSQFPRWPMVILTLSSAEAGSAAASVAAARAKANARTYAMVKSPDCPAIVRQGRSRDQGGKRHQPCVIRPLRVAECRWPIAAAAALLGDGETMVACSGSGPFP